MSDIELHPVQTPSAGKYDHARLSSLVTLRAYEVYCALYGEQHSMVDFAGRGCRGGFSTGGLICFLYARTFPKDEWRKRFDEAMRGMRGL